MGEKGSVLVGRKGNIDCEKTCLRLYIIVFIWVNQIYWRLFKIPKI